MKILAGTGLLRGSPQRRPQPHVVHGSCCASKGVCGHLGAAIAPEAPGPPERRPLPAELSETPPWPGRTDCLPERVVRDLCAGFSPLQAGAAGAGLRKTPQLCPDLSAPWQPPKSHPHEVSCSEQVRFWPVWIDGPRGRSLRSSHLLSECPNVVHCRLLNHENAA